ncbi:galactose mutarotase-like protein [Serendipita vermifera]|nr:galactose mutarotase-like protein [Serendipita vermifera]
MPYEKTESKVILKHPNGASAEILLYGATVISWKSAAQSGGDIKERLFVSSKSPLDGSKPVRGGIPVVFPIFGPPVRPEHSKLSQHGFARSSVWSWAGEILDNEAGVSIRLKLDPTLAIKDVFPHEFNLTYVVTLAAHELSTNVHVENPSTDNTLSFQTLLHTYYAADASAVKVEPLKGLTYINKVKGGIEETENRDIVDVQNFTDFVYRDAPRKYTIHTGDATIHLKAIGLNDVVVWNPGQDAGSKIGDMEDKGWERYVCVEPGSASYFVDLPPGERWIGGQAITIVENI